MGDHADPAKIVIAIGCGLIFWMRYAGKHAKGVVGITYSMIQGIGYGGQVVIGIVCIIRDITHIVLMGCHISIGIIGVCYEGGIGKGDFFEARIAEIKFIINVSIVFVNNHFFYFFDLYSF
jgi:hypothetical protein